MKRLLLAALCSVPITAAAQDLTFQSLQAAEAPVYGDITYGAWGTWIGSDTTSGRLNWVMFNGSIVNSVFIGVDATNLYPGIRRTLFAGRDANLLPKIGGYVDYSKIVMADLPPNFLNQGASLTGSPDGFGVITSRSLNAVLWFQSTNYSAAPVIRTLPFSPRGVDFGPGGNYYMGSSTGVQVLTPTWTLSAIPNYTTNITAIRGCGDTLWVGGTDYLDFWQDMGEGYLQAKFKRFSGLNGSTIMSIDCGQNGKAMAVGSARYLFYLDPIAGKGNAFQVTGSTEFVKISLGPGSTPNGLILDTQGTLANFRLSADFQYQTDRNVAAQRLVYQISRNLVF